MYHGDINLGDTIDFKFSTVNASGVPTTLAGSPVLSAYVGNGTTEITAGITLSVDFDGRTGLNNVRVVATSGNGFATATNIDIVITTGTVNSVSVVGIVVGSFSIESRSSLRPTVAGRTLDVTATGGAGIDLANVENQGSTLGLTATTIAVVSAVTGLTASNLDATISSRATPAQILTTALAEAYAADGAAGTLSQILFGIQSFLQERVVSGVTQTCKKLDGATTSMTFTLDSATTPTNITRAT